MAEGTGQRSAADVRRRVLYEGRDFATQMSQRGISTCASSVAFFFFLSLIPLVIVLSTVLPLLGFEEQMMVRAVTAVTPDMVDGLVTRILHEAYNAGGRVLPTSLLMLLWASAAGMLALIRGLNIVYGAEERRNFLVLTLLSIFYTVMLLVLFISMMYFAVFTRSIREFLYNIISEKDAAYYGVEQLRYRIVFLLSVVIFMLMYRFFPAGKRYFMAQLPGALFTSLGFLVFSWLFSIYMSGANRYTLFYGSLTATAIFLFWLYCCFYIFLVGAYINQYFEESLRMLHQWLRERSRKKKEGPAPEDPFTGEDR